MESLTALEIADIVSAVTSPVSDNFVAILTLLATVAGISLVFKYIKKGAK